MAAVLIVSRDHKQLSTVSLTGETVVVGRSKQCQVHLDDADVSRRHTTIRAEDGLYFVANNGSMNGTLLNGRKLTAEEELKSGDVLTVGPYSLTFHADDSGMGAAPGEDEPATRFMPSSAVEEELPGRKIVRKTAQGALHVKVSVLDGPLEGGTFEDWQGDLTIGRALDNNVVLLDDAVTTYHARIYEKADGYYIEDLGSHNGTFVQGVKVSDEKLPRAAKIRIGVTTMQFKITDTVQKKKKRIKLAAIGGSALVLLLLLAKLFAPGDEAQQYTAKGKELSRARNYEEAEKAFRKALACDGDFEPAKAGLKEVKTIREADQVIARAATAAEEARFDDALTIAETAIRIAPTYRRAIRAKDNIKAMSEAEVAFNAHNWTDAVRLYKSIAAEYPESKLVPKRLGVAESEFNAMQSIATASNQVQHEQYKLARTTLSSVTTASVYRAAAQQMLAGIQWREEMMALLATSDVTKLKQALELMVNNQDLLTAMGMPNDDMKSKVGLRLEAISLDLATRAKEQVRIANRSEGFRLYERALEANSNNAEAKQAADNIRQMVRTECAAYLRDARKYESLGQLAAAKGAYQKVLQFGIAGENYFEFAKAKVAQLK